MRAPRRHLAAAIASCSFVSVGLGCTFLVDFDTRADAGACDGGCAFDSTRPPDVGPDDVEVPPDVDGDFAPDVLIPADVGDCSLLPEGSPCAKPTACTMTATCKSGSCVAAPVADGTPCGGGSGAAPCHSAPACKAGVCVPEMPLPDGTSCGTTVDACHSVPSCANGTCTASSLLPDGTKCGAAPDACHDAPTCTHGSCGAAVAKADGTAWKSGDPNARCCGGAPVETTSDTNCGVCGWACTSGTTCTLLDGEYLCTGCGAGTDCASNCCSTDPSPAHCSPSNCQGACQSPDVCTGGSHCVSGATLDYCAY